MLGFVAILAVSLMRVGLCGYFSCQSDACWALWLYFSCQSDALWLFSSQFDACWALWLF